MEGRVLSNRYHLRSKLGEGGMGSVWLADDLVLRTPAAVKLMDPGIASSPEATERFKREAQAAAALRSSHVVQILEYGVDGGTPYIAMELLDGESLAGRLSRLTVLGPSETATLLAQVGKALTLAHQRGVVHRDLKPDNIFMAREGDEEIAKVLDFGIAKATGSMSTSGGMQTRTGAMLGTPYYMSPEQMQGRRTVDHRTDIWSLGIIAFECLTGRRPFDAPTLGGLAVAICTEPVQPPSRMAPVPNGFDAWFARAVERDPDARYPTVAEAVSTLVAVCGGQPVLSSAAPSGSSAVQGEVTACAPGSTGMLSQWLPEKATDLALTPGPSSRTIANISAKRTAWGLAIALGLAVLAGIGGLFAWRGSSATKPEATLDVSDPPTAEPHATRVPVNARGDDRAQGASAPSPASASLLVGEASTVTDPGEMNVGSQVEPKPAGSKSKPRQSAAPKRKVADPKKLAPDSQESAAPAKPVAPATPTQSAEERLGF